MIKLIAFDLDGVLLDAKEIHYQALNRALREINPMYEITREEHLTTYDGLPTKVKLEKLSVDKGLHQARFDYINHRKQLFTIKALKTIGKNNRLASLLCELDNSGYKLAVVSNSIRETIDVALAQLGIAEFFDYIISNEMVSQPKPHPEAYLWAMIIAGVDPDETLIVEDSIHGREAAIRSGGHLCPINNLSDVDRRVIFPYLNKAEGKRKFVWKDGEMNVLIPMAGAGSRFAQAGYTFPKPLIEVNNMGGKPMIQVVVENLNIDANFIYIVQKEHYQKYALFHLLNLITPGCRIIQVDGVTEGAACTTLLARHYIDNDQPLLIANSDQFVEWDSNKFLYTMQDGYDAGIVTFPANGVKWSFVKTENNLVTEVAEKKPISDVGTVGIYWWKHGKDYVAAADQMIAKDIRTNGEFYVAPVFNEAIECGKIVRDFRIDKMWGLGTPEDLEYFVNNKEV